VITNCDFPVLAYHKVDSRRELGITSISPQRFEKQISFLNSEGYSVISPQSLVAFGSEHGHVDDSHIPSKPVIVTFDDGYEGIYSYAYPILEKYESTAVIFLTTGYIGKLNNWDASPGPRFKHLNWSQITEMSEAGICFGSHGVNHYFLTRQNNRAAKYEIEASKKELEDKLGKAIRFFSYPYGDYDDRIIILVREAGYEAAFSLRPELLRSNSTNGFMSLYELPRIAIYLVDNMRAFKAKIGYGHSTSLQYTQKLKNRLINRCAYASVLVERLRS